MKNILLVILQYNEKVMVKLGLSEMWKIWMLNLEIHNPIEFAPVVKLMNF